MYIVSVHSYIVYDLVTLLCLIVFLYARSIFFTNRQSVFSESAVVCIYRFIKSVVFYSNGGTIIVWFGFIVIQESVERGIRQSSVN